MSRPVAIALAAAMGLGGWALWLCQSPRVAAQSGASLPSEQLPTTVPSVRVLLGEPARESCQVRLTGPYSVTAVGDFRVLAQGDRLETTRVSVGPQGLKIAAQQFPAWQLEIKLHQSGTLWVDGVRYRGALRLLAQPDGRLAAINVLGLEEYLASVLPSEMPGDFPLAAQQAQTIAARSYALFQMKTYGANHNYDLHNSPRSQSYRGMEYRDAAGRALAVESAESRRVIEQTRGATLAYQGRLICSYYSAVCGGHTFDGAAVFGQAAPPLVGVPCEHCQAAPNFRWRHELSISEATRQLERANLVGAVGQITALRVDDPGGGRLPQVRLDTAQGPRQLSAAAFQTHVLGPKALSARYQLTVQQAQIRVEGNGWGHGVGLCQWGARTLAAQGLSCEQILAYYYPGSELVRVQ